MAPLTAGATDLRLPRKPLQAEMNVDDELPISQVIKAGLDATKSGSLGGA
jgi:hypothetical protein